MIDLCNCGAERQILDANCLQIKKIGNHLVSFVFGIVQSSRDQIGLHVFGPTSTEGFIVPVFHKSQLSSVEDHTNIRVREIIFLLPRAPPLDLRGLILLKVTHYDCVVRICYNITVLKDIYFTDL